MAVFPIPRMPILVLALSGLVLPGEPVAPAPVRLAAVWDADADPEARRLVQARVKAWSPDLVIDFGAGRMTPGGALGPVQLFVLDGASGDPAAGDPAARRLRDELRASTAPWKFVCIQDSPYPRGEGRGEVFRWPLKEWGADAVLSGHDRRYERLEIDGLACFAGGAGVGTDFDAGSLPGSRCVYEEEHGALLIEAEPGRVDFRYVTAEGVVVDAHSLRKPVLAGPPAAPGHPAAPTGGAAAANDVNSVNAVKAVKAGATFPPDR